MVVTLPACPRWVHGSVFCCERCFSPHLPAPTMHQGFLSEGSLCGRGLLELVARGSAIIAELLRLSEHIPGALIPGTTDPLQTKYHAVLFDFRWVGVRGTSTVPALSLQCGRRGQPRSGPRMLTALQSALHDLACTLVSRFGPSCDGARQARWPPESPHLRPKRFFFSSPPPPPAPFGMPTQVPAQP